MKVILAHGLTLVAQFRGRQDQHSPIDLLVMGLYGLVGVYCEMAFAVRRIKLK
jgi:hypothetical protein